MIPPPTEQPVVDGRGADEEDEQLLLKTTSVTPFLTASTAISTSPYSHTATLEIFAIIYVIGIREEMPKTTLLRPTFKIPHSHVGIP